MLGLIQNIKQCARPLSDLEAHDGNEPKTFPDLAHREPATARQGSASIPFGSTSTWVPSSARDASRATRRLTADQATGSCRALLMSARA